MAVLDAERDPGLGRDGRQMHDRIGRPARGRDGGRGVLQAGAGDVFAGRVTGDNPLDDQAAASFALGRLARIDGGHVVGSHRGEAHHRQRHGHGVGRELAAAGSGAGADSALDRLQPRVIQRADRVGTNGLEDVLNRNLAGADLAGQDGAAVVNQSGDIHPGQGHGRRRNCLVAADNADDAVQLVALDRQFDRICNDLSADQGGFHPRRAHGDAVGDDDSVEIHGPAARGPDSSPNIVGQPVQMHVAGCHRGPGVDDGDHRLVEVGILHPCSSQIAAGRGAVRTRRDGAAARVGRTTA